MFNKKVIFYATLINTLYLISTFFTVSDSFLNAPLGITNLFALVLMYLNHRAHRTEKSEFKKSGYVRVTEWLCFLNVCAGISLIVFI